MQSRPPEFPFQDLVLLEPGPEHREIIQDMHRADMEALDAFGLAEAVESMDDFALAGPGAGVEDEDREEGRHGDLDVGWRVRPILPPGRPDVKGELVGEGCMIE